jgi:hypothetical protein
MTARCWRRLVRQSCADAENGAAVRRPMLGVIDAPIAESTFGRPASPLTIFGRRRRIHVVEFIAPLLGLGDKSGLTTIALRHIRPSTP